ncbi:MAG: hypothetical protein ACR2MG_18660 [Pyrinomonadaceae bacterium]
MEEADTRGVQTARGIRFKQKFIHNQLAVHARTVGEVVIRVLYRL